MTLRTGPAFGAVAATLVLFMAASGVPSPLYVVYQQQWHFPTAILTVVFAVYVLGLLAAVLVTGRLSDHVGRRPVILASLALEAVSLVVFLLAGDVGALMVARLLQGVATGAAITALSATLVDLSPDHLRARAGLVTSVGSISGLAAGALGGSALVEWAPAPTRTVFVVVLAGVVVALAAMLALPETTTRKPGARASLRPRVGLPPRLRGEFISLTPILIASWALGGLYFSLAPSAAVGVFGLTDHLVGGIVIALLGVSGAVTAVALRGLLLPRVLTIAAAGLAAGTFVSVIGIVAGSIGLAAAGTVIAGVGFGASALGSFATLAAAAAPEERGEVFALAYTVSYLAFSVPAMVAGVAATLTGLYPTMLVYSSVVVLLGLAALVLRRRLVPVPA
jgi:MFS family permease